jgi:hypothetical protein
VSVVIGIACEDSGHFSTVTRLVDDTLVTSHDWLDGVLADCRSWRGLKEGEAWYKYDPDDAHDLRPIVHEGQRIARHGLIKGEPLKPEAGMWRKVLMLFCDADPRPDVVILARDLDGYPGRRPGPTRRDGIQQVREGFSWPFKIAVATPEPEIEAWLVSGFVPAGPDEQARLLALRRALSFDPTTQSERLTSHPNDAATDAKRVLAQLCGDEQERREACLADRELLRRRGGANGAAAFLDEVDELVVPRFAASR